MSNIKLSMTDWNIPQTTPPINLGDSGENNAILISIDIDNKIDFDDVKYYLDIMDKLDGEKTVSRTQELELVEHTETHEVVDEEGNVTEETTTTYSLDMHPLAQWLGNDSIKYLQVRCEYTDNTDTENPISIIIKSNTFKGIVHMGLYPQNSF